jgi:hypothetical protein
MAEWIITIIAILGFIISVISFFMREQKKKTEQDARDSALNSKIDSLKETVELKITPLNTNVNDIKEILGNGHGLRHDIHEMQTYCAGEMGSLKVKVAAQQHEIDDLKEAK